jgi:hypothetical protein
MNHPNERSGLPTLRRVGGFGLSSTGMTLLRTHPDRESLPVKQGRFVRIGQFRMTGRPRSLIGGLDFGHFPKPAMTKIARQRTA